VKKESNGRPIAINGNQGALCRPPEKILDLLD
jgi:hypothetical protein